MSTKDKKGREERNSDGKEKIREGQGRKEKGREGKEKEGKIMEEKA